MHKKKLSYTMQKFLMEGPPKIWQQLRMTHYCSKYKLSDLLGDKIIIKVIPDRYH